MHDRLMTVSVAALYSIYIGGFGNEWGKKEGKGSRALSFEACKCNSILPHSYIVLEECDV